MRHLFITTTNNVDNGNVVEYFGIVSSHIVAGTGFFSDLAAGFSDIFGGRSNSYRRQLEGLYNEALEELSDKAHLLGANSILGLKIDIDDISGKGKSMFMITAVGTAAKVELDTEGQTFGSQDFVTSTALVNEIAKREILEILNDEKLYFKQRNWETILKYPDNDYVLPLSKRLFDLGDYSEQSYQENFKNNYVQFIQMVDRNLVVEGIYEGLKTSNGFGLAQTIIKEYSLFDAKKLLALVKDGYINRVIAVLCAEQPSYTQNDLQDMETLLVALDNLPDIGRIEVVKGGMFSKEGEKFICACGHKNDLDVEFCASCGKNIKGLNESEIKAIAAFKNRVSVLKDLLSK